MTSGIKQQKMMVLGMAAELGEQVNEHFNHHLKGIRDRITSIEDANERTAFILAMTYIGLEAAETD